MLVVVAFFHCTCADSTCTFYAHYAITDLLSFLMISKYIDTATASNGENTLYFYAWHILLLCMVITKKSFTDEMVDNEKNVNIYFPLDYTTLAK